MSAAAHRRRAAEGGRAAIRCAIVAVSDTRTLETDAGGALLERRLSEAGFAVCGRRVIPDEPDRVAEALEALADQAEAVLFTGGTGVSRRDCTARVLAARLERTLPGFGELFRMLSFQEIGPAAMLSGALAGVYGGALVVALPGSTAAVRLALDQLILPELEHLVWELRR